MLSDIDRLLAVLRRRGAASGRAHPRFKDHAVDRVILHDQHIHAVRFDAIGVRVGLSGLIFPADDLALDGEGEDGPLAELRLHRDVAAHDVGQTPRNGQTQTGAAKASGR